MAAAHFAPPLLLDSYDSVAIEYSNQLQASRSRVRETEAKIRTLEDEIAFFRQIIQTHEQSSSSSPSSLSSKDPNSYSNLSPEIALDTMHTDTTNRDMTPLSWTVGAELMRAETPMLKRRSAGDEADMGYKKRREDRVRESDHLTQKLSFTRRSFEETEGSARMERKRKGENWSEGEGGLERRGKKVWAR